MTGRLWWLPEISRFWRESGTPIENMKLVLEFSREVHVTNADDCERLGVKTLNNEGIRRELDCVGGAAGLAVD